MLQNLQMNYLHLPHRLYRRSLSGPGPKSAIHHQPRAFIAIATPPANLDGRPARFSGNPSQHILDRIRDSNWLEPKPLKTLRQPRWHLISDVLPTLEVSSHWNIESRGPSLAIIKTCRKSCSIANLPVHAFDDWLDLTGMPEYPSKACSCYLIEVASLLREYKITIRKIFSLEVTKICKSRLWYFLWRIYFTPSRSLCPLWTTEIDRYADKEAEQFESTWTSTFLITIGYLEVDSLDLTKISEVAVVMTSSWVFELNSFSLSTLLSHVSGRRKALSRDARYR